MSSNKENNSTSSYNRFDDEIFVALFRKGAHDYLENDLFGDLPENTDDVQSGLSEIANKKIKKMISQAIRREKNMRIIKHLPRIVAIVLIVVVVCSITVMSVEALRLPFLNLFVNTEEKIMDIKIEEGETYDEDNSLAGLFGYIPEGYELTSEDNQNQATTLIYINKKGESIFIKRFDSEGNLGVDTENADYGELLINDDIGFYSTKNGLTTLVFSKNEYAYYISASIDLSEIIKISKNIK